MYQVRKAGLGDIPGIYFLIQSATNRGKILKRPKAEIRKSIRHCWVMEKEKKELVACCALEIYNKKLGEIRSLAVHPKEEKKGLATKLVERCVAQAKKHKVYEVFVITNRENIFRRFGFSEQLHDQTALFVRP